VDLDAARRAMTPKVRAIVAVSPNNPTGHYLAPHERAALAALGVPLIVDEVFYEYRLDGGPVAEAKPADDGLVFSLGGLSKLGGLPQLKLAWTTLSGAPALVEEARQRLELVADTFLSVATPIQTALPRLLELVPEITLAITARCRQNLAYLQRCLVGSALSALRVEGGWSAVLRFPRLQSEDEIVARLVREQCVLVQPGWFYDFESEPHVIVSLLTPPSAFEDGVNRCLVLANELSR
jgi:aspartate/methionine/tyrosine aminotransferase